MGIRIIEVLLYLDDGLYNTDTAQTVSHILQTSDPGFSYTPLKFTTHRTQYQETI